MRYRVRSAHVWTGTERRGHNWHPPGFSQHILSLILPISMCHVPACPYCTPHIDTIQQAAILRSYLTFLPALVCLFPQFLQTQKEVLGKQITKNHNLILYYSNNENDFNVPFGHLLNLLAITSPKEMRGCCSGSGSKRLHWNAKFSVNISNHFHMSDRTLCKSSN